jgi:hypothetical protein
MLLFSAKTRRLLDIAVEALPDASRRAVWQGWVKEHPNIRLPAGPTHNEEAPLPGAVAEVALSALEIMADRKKSRQQVPDVSEDELSELDNDLSYIGAVTQMIKEATYIRSP